MSATASADWVKINGAAATSSEKFIDTDAILQTLSTKPGDYSSRLLRSFELIQTNDMSSAIEILDRVLSELKGIMATMNRANA